MNLFNKDYYENGIEKGISGYEDYHWIPTRSLPEAISINNNFNFSSAMDFGCAKGFLVHALSLITNKEIFGSDISDYAINNSLPQVKKKLFKIKEYPSELKLNVDLLIAKDVLEHINENKIDSYLRDFYEISNQVLLVIPLGDNDKFRIREYEMDKTMSQKKTKNGGSLRLEVQDSN